MKREKILKEIDKINRRIRLYKGLKRFFLPDGELLAIVPLLIFTMYGH